MFSTVLVLPTKYRHLGTDDSKITLEGGCRGWDYEMLCHQEQLPFELVCSQSKTNRLHYGGNYKP